MTCMTTTYFNSVKKYLFSLQPLKANRWLLVAFFVLAQTFTFGQITGDYRSNGNVTFAAATNWQIYNGTSWVNATIAPATALYTVSNTINVQSGDAATVSISVTIAAQLLVEGTFTLNSSANLSIGPIVVNYNGAGNAVVVNAGSALTVNGNFTVTKGDMSVAGSIYIDGNFSTTTGNVDVTGGGSMASSGSMTTQGNSEIFGSKSECSIGPCSGTSLNCQSVISPASQVICQSSQSTPITITPSGVTVVRWESTTDFLNFIPINNTTTTLPAQNVSQTTRFRAVYRSSGCSGDINSPYATVTVSAANTWTGTTSSSWFIPNNWSCLSVPTAASDVIIANVTNKPIVDDSSKIALANTLIVNSGSSLTVNSGNTLKVTDKVTNNSGTITFEDSASLVQTTSFTGANSGNITYKRQAGVRNTDYTYWSTPVSPLKLAGIGGISYSPPSLAGSIFYSYLVTASSENWKSETATTPMIPGLGYSIRASGAISSNPPGFLEASFTGVPNNGGYSVAIAKSGASYLLGNPYPSALDADSFILANTGAIDGTLYFWTHNTPIAIGTPDPGTGVYAYSGNDYATYTLSGGVGTAGNTAPEWVDANSNKIVDTGEWTDTNGNNIVDAVEWVDANNNKVVDSGEWTDSNGDNILNLEVEQVSNRPTGKIAAGQGFFTTSSTTGSLVTFTNAMRINGSGNPLNNSNFYKTKNSKTKTATAFEKHRVWLNLSNTEGAFKQTLVGYITGASNNWDKLYDGLSFDGNDFLDFYSINEEKNFTIQGRALPFDENDEIPLGYRIAVEGNFTINIDETDGLLANQNVFLEDKLTNKTVNLKDGKYTFKTAAGTFDDRFVLSYNNKTLGKEEVELKDGIIALYSNNYKTLIIRNNVTDATVDAVELFNMLGQSIANWDVKDNEQTNIQIPIKNTSSGIYVVKIKTTQGESNIKIIIK